MKKLLFITTRVFWPPYSGHKVMLYHYCRGLHEKYGYNIYLYSFSDGDPCVEDPPNFIYEYKPALQINTSSKISNLLKKTLFSNWPLQCSIYYSDSNKNALWKFYQSIQPDVLIVDMIRLAPYLDAFINEPIKRYMYYDDDLAKRYKRQVETAIKSSQPFGKLQMNRKGLLHLFSFALLQRFVLNYEAKKINEYECTLNNHFDKAIFVSSVETEEYNMRYPGKAVNIPMGIPQMLTQMPSIEKRGNILSFMGEFTTAANVDSLAIIINKILPHIKTDVYLRVIGNCPNVVRRLYHSVENVEFTGRVDDLREAICSTSIFLSPIAYGTGIKTKILEAMAMGMPVLTNSVGAEGIEAENGVHFIIEDDLIKIANSVDWLLANETKRRHLGSAARQLMKEKYIWEKTWQAFDQLDL